MADEAPQKSKKKLIIGVVGAVVVLGGAYMFLGGGGGAPEEEVAVTTTLEPVEGPVIEAEQMTVNLADKDLRYARIKFAVVLPEGGDTTAVGQRVPVLKDAVLSVMASYTADQLLGPDALDGLREEFTAKAQEVWPAGDVLRVVITEVLVQ